MDQIFVRTFSKKHRGERHFQAEKVFHLNITYFILFFSAYKCFDLWFCEEDKSIFNLDYFLGME